MRDKKTWGFVSGVMKKAIDSGLFHAGLNPLEVGMMLWSNLNGLLRQLERNEEYWHGRMGVDLRKTLRKSNGLLVEAMMTEKAMQLYPDQLHPPRVRWNTGEEVMRTIVDGAVLALTASAMSRRSV